MLKKFIFFFFIFILIFEERKENKKKLIYIYSSIYIVGLWTMTSNIGFAVILMLPF
jgi:hypothetical protein